MREKDDIRFYDTVGLTEPGGLRGRANTAYLSKELANRFPGESLTVKSVGINDSGKYSRMLTRIYGLPAYCAVKLLHKTGRHTEEITVWSPLGWNGRFIGTGGGGTATGGDFYITRPDNTSRGMTLPKALLNGFTAATTDAANPGREWALDESTGKRDWERIENWRAKSTHFMTLAGKAVAEILHGRPVQYSYFHGGSGGGRQAMVEAQEFPQDYDGIWASCPAINWARFLPQGLWAGAVMNSRGHILSPKKIKFFMEAAQNSVGGADAYFRREAPVPFDPLSLAGQQTSVGIITENDAEIMQALWDGPRRPGGERLWYGFRPGVLFWNVGIPIGAFYYTLFRKRPKPFLLSTYYARWVTENPKETFENITEADYFKLFDESNAIFAKANADDVNLAPFANAGGKLLIDHGIDDPLIPVDGTIDYYKRLCAAMGGKGNVDTFCRLYVNPGDGHGSCNWHGPGITEKDGMAALVNWVEKDVAPESIRVVQVDKKGNTLHEGTQSPYNSNLA